MKKHIAKALKWALSKFDKKPEELKEWPFPAVSEDFEPRPKTKRKPAAKKVATKKVTVPKATTRTKKAK